MKSLLIALLLFPSFAVADGMAKIVGGEESPQGEFDAVVVLLDKGKIDSGKTAYEAQFCGASLIAPTYVLTAAHCITQDAGKILIYYGSNDLLFGGKTIFVKRATVHRKYNYLTTDYDYALLELSQPIDNPIIKVSKNKPLSIEKFTVSGWGDTETDGYPSKLRNVTVPYFLWGACKKSYPGLTDRMWCAGFPEGQKDSCQGDSGGPIMRKTAVGYDQVGIVSHGAGCADAGFPGVYARTDNMHDWIRLQMLKNDFPQTISNGGALSLWFLMAFLALVLFRHINNE